MKPMNLGKVIFGTLLVISVLACKQEGPKKASNDLDPIQNNERKGTYNQTKRIPKKVEEKKYDKSEMTTITFEETSFDFGNINAANGKVSHYYTFTNSGDKPLMIEVKPGCGCTLGSAPKDPILPGKKDSIRLEFNPANFKGDEVKKTATVRGNIPETVYLSFKAKIQP